MDASRRSTPALSRQRIVDEALRIAAQDGVDGLTLRPLAARLGVSAPALYRYVESRTALLALMLQRRLEEQTPLPPGLPWREALEETTAAMWRVYGPYPGLAAETLAGRVAVPRTEEAAAGLIGSLVDAGFAHDAAVEAAICVVHWALSFLAGLEHRPADGAGYADLPGVRPASTEAIYRQGVELMIAGLAAQLGADG